MTKKILLLGSGELGKEFVIACKRLGQYVVACDKYEYAPAMQVADEHRVFNMLDGDELMRVVNEVQPDIIVPEIEAIRTEKLYECEKQGIQVVPSARAVNFTMNRKAIRELAHTELGLTTANYRYACTYEELQQAAQEIGFPCIIKPLMSSSGHGQSKVDNAGELEQAWHCACEGCRGDIMEVIVEEFIPFDYEITLLTVTQQHGPTLFCAPIGHVQKGGDYRESFQPRCMKPEHLAEAQRMAAQVTEALTGAGIWGVEFFVSESRGVIFSELSPRPHDTGMVTMAGTQNLTEFELHCRAVLGLPIPEITLERQGASAVILSEVETECPEYEGMEQVCAATQTYLRIFGKPVAHVGRRMGVVVCWNDVNASQEELRDKCKQLAAQVKVK
ncbi:MAG: formate-dependent phosphoribosylglycinamide formyltransferase [Paraprevotella sp.]|nr:formate-dependent phosphoribosylglycinamide formyltransferase [Paraprevotella sp.]MDY3098641.1 formate-dependent phosphoribosylglycinamide formyltransferase [Bacteroidaceae bacterium]MCI7141716.1 formate-dependent phosphoribosylglycinamide formyltransferase [Paraprevotella sp.]MDY4615776.1 formate-dependent phosphoribosylglycinamide formyltransferase [Bacteroidaceae bacterium]MDY5077095.1 formate-dependent phosphoribosylglycinamide formyltransferase [Bacteroidaceae bacterium]